LEVERRGAQYRARVKNGASGESHQWFDSVHVGPFLQKEGDDISGEEDSSDGRLHSSVEAFVRLKMKDSDLEEVQPEVLLDILRRERPKLYSLFKPTLQ
jgi:hypothetical protein